MSCKTSEKKLCNFLILFPTIFKLRDFRNAIFLTSTWNPADIFVATGQTVLSRLNKKNYIKTWKSSANAPCDFEIIQLLSLTVFQTPTDTAGKSRKKKQKLKCQCNYIFLLKTTLGWGKGTSTTKTAPDSILWDIFVPVKSGKKSRAFFPGNLVTFIQQPLFVLCSLPPSAQSLGCSAFPHFPHLNCLPIQGPFSHWNFLNTYMQVTAV